MDNYFSANYLSELDPEAMEKVKYGYGNQYLKPEDFEESCGEETFEQTLEPNLEIGFLQGLKNQHIRPPILAEDRMDLEDLEDYEDDDNIIMQDFDKEIRDPSIFGENKPPLLENIMPEKKKNTTLKDKINTLQRSNIMELDKDREKVQANSNRKMTQESTGLKKSLERKLKSGKKHYKKSVSNLTADFLNEDFLSFFYGKASKRSYVKKSAYKNYNELLWLTQCLSKIEWTDTDRPGSKLLSTKVISPSVIWFLICANYFPRNAFAHKNTKEFIHQRFEKLKNYVPDIPQRLDKNIIRTETIQKTVSTQSEQEDLNKLSKAIKAWVDSGRTNEYLEKTMGARTINLIQKSNYTSKDDEWISEIKTFIHGNWMYLQTNGFLECDNGDSDSYDKMNQLSKIELQDLINLYEKNLFQASVENERRLNRLEEKAFSCLDEEDILHKLNFEPNDSLVDLRIRFPEEDHYLAYLEKKQNEARELAKISKEAESPVATARKGNGKTVNNHTSLRIRSGSVNNNVGMICQICNDDNSNDTDLIVSCSGCNLSVHQNCYGIFSPLQGNWTCETCANFGKNGMLLRCPFCTVRGGAMKPTQVKADTNIFKNLNPDYHLFLKSYGSTQSSKNSSQAKKQNALTPSSEAANASVQRLDLKEDDLETEAENDREDLNKAKGDEPRPKHIWTHITCALFLPELYFKDSTNVTNIAGIESVNKERFQQECEICGMKEAGAVISCAKTNCKKAFHVECARRARYYLDTHEINQGQVVYQIFCEKHIPLELKRKLESKEKETKEDIEKFFRAVEKYLITILSEPKIPVSVSNSVVFPQESKPVIKKRKHKNKDDGSSFLELVEKYREKKTLEPSTITLKKNKDEEDKEIYQIIDIRPPRPPLQKNKRLTSDDEIWLILPYKTLTPRQKYVKYKKLLAHVREYNTFLMSKLREKHNKEASNSLQDNKKKSTSISISREPDTVNKSSRILTDDQKELQPHNPVYCYCQKPYKGELMIACEKCEEWYHPQCVGIFETKGLSKLAWCCEKCKQSGDEEKTEATNTRPKKRPNKYNLEEEDGAFINKKLKTEKKMHTRYSRG